MRAPTLTLSVSNVIIALAGCTVLAWAQPAASQPPAAAPEQAAPGAACLKCHTPIQAVLQKKVKHAAVEMGCDSCHVNHRDKNAAAGAKEPHYLSDKQPAVCGACHELTDKKLADAHKGQPFSTADCSGCHDPHASDKPKLIADNAHGPFDARQCDSCHKPPKEGKIVLTAASSSEICFECHADIQDKFKAAKSKHTLLASDPNACTDCHDPHASRHKKALKQPVATICGSCHSDIGADKKFAHRPVADSCTICHDPHSSDHAKNLHASRQAVCLECHDAAGVKKFISTEPVSLFGGKVTLPAQPYPDLKVLRLRMGKGHPMMNHPVSAGEKDGKPGFDCVTCHLPHGANGSPVLLVTEKPTTSGLCVRCHK